MKRYTAIALTAMCLVGSCYVGTSNAAVDCDIVAKAVVVSQKVHVTQITLDALADTCRGGEASYLSGVPEKDYMDKLKAVVTKTNENAGNDPKIVKATSLMAIADMVGYKAAKAEGAAK